MSNIDKQFATATRHLTKSTAKATAAMAGFVKASQLSESWRLDKKVIELRLGTIVSWKAENKKGRIVTKTGKVSKLYDAAVVVRSGRKEYNVPKRQLIL